MNQLALEKDYYIQMQEEEIARLSQVCNPPRYPFSSFTPLGILLPFSMDSELGSDIGNNKEVQG